MRQGVQGTATGLSHPRSLLAGRRFQGDLVMSLQKVRKGRGWGGGTWSGSCPVTGGPPAAASCPTFRQPSMPLPTLICSPCLM